MAGRIAVVGIGPGSPEGMTLEAFSVLRDSEVIVGYTVYVDLIREAFRQLIPDTLQEKEFVTTSMRQEIERCRLCFDHAARGRRVSLVCSGDAGVYGMAAPMYELWQEYGEKPEHHETELFVVGGVTAANSGAAVLGAPLGHDYCVISLSDLLTPWDLIERRIRAAVEGDFAMALYNPSSHKRRDYLQKACDIMLAAGADGERACGFVENIGREGMRSGVLPLRELREKEVNMFTTVFIGNSQSEMRDGKLITKRGYEI